MLKLFKTNHYSSRFWRFKSVVRAGGFAWRHPRHVQIAVHISNSDFSIDTNYSGLSDYGHRKVIKELAREIHRMEQTEKAAKDLLNKN